MILVISETPLSNVRTQVHADQGVYLIDTEKAETDQEHDFVRELLILKKDGGNTIPVEFSITKNLEFCQNIMINSPAMVEKIISYWLD